MVRTQTPDMETEPSLVMEIVTDSKRLESDCRRRARAEANYRWLADHAEQIRATCRGKCVCIAGKELFVGDTPEQALVAARAGHPEDDGIVLHYVPKTKTIRVYSC